MSACAVFLLALCTSLQTVPLEAPILFPASSCDSLSRSTSLNIGVRLAGFGINLEMVI